MSLEKPRNPLALARAVVIIPSGTIEIVSRLPPCTRGNEARDVSARCSIVETAGSVREEIEEEHHLRVEKACGSLRSYLTEALGPHVGYPLCRGTNED
jgi:hypothetical protein